MKVDLHNHSRKYHYQFQTKDTGIIGVYGISGSGKSSLLDAMAGYDDKVRGTIELNNKSLTGTIKCAYMNQHPILFEHWTIKQNLEFVKQYHNIPYDDYLNKLHCEDLINKYPRQLSGGEKQRIAFIRTLIQIHANSLVLLDEPFSALDKSVRKIALSLLVQQKQAIIFLVTHDINELYQVADEFLYLKESIIEYQNTIANTMKRGINDLPIASKIILNNSEHIIYADEVSISLDKNPNSSIQNQLICSIQSIKNDGAISVLELITQKCQQTLFAKITQDSLNHLKLTPNKRIIANFKALSTHN